MASAKALARLAPMQVRGSHIALAATRMPGLQAISIPARRPAFAALQSVRRSYATAGPEARLSPTEPPNKPKRFRRLRWAWRLTYLSLIGGLGYTGYSIYKERHPDPQIDPDPLRKTLVILGESPAPGSRRRPA